MNSMNEALKAEALRLLAKKRRILPKNMKPPENQTVKDLLDQKLLWVGANFETCGCGLILGSSNYGYTREQGLGLEYYIETDDDNLWRGLYNFTHGASLNPKRPELRAQRQEFYGMRLTNTPTISRRNLLKWADDGTRRS